MTKYIPYLLLGKNVIALHRQSNCNVIHDIVKKSNGNVIHYMVKKVMVMVILIEVIQCNCKCTALLCNVIDPRPVHILLYSLLY